MEKLRDKKRVFLAKRTHIYNYGEEDETVHEDVCAVFESSGEGIKWLKQYAKELQHRLSGHEITKQKWNGDSDYGIWYTEYLGGESCYMVALIPMSREEFKDVW